MGFGPLQSVRSNRRSLPDGQSQLESQGSLPGPSETSQGARLQQEDVVMRSYRRDPSIVQDYAMQDQERVRRREQDDFDREDLQS